MTSHHTARQSLRLIRCIASLSLILGSLWLASCAPADAPRRSGGAVSEYGPWLDMNPDEAQLNIAQILGKKLDVYQWRSRDGAVLHYMVRFDSGKGVIQVQYAPSHFFRTHDTESVRSKDDFRTHVLAVTKASAADIAEPVRLFSENLRTSRYGYVTTIKTPARGIDCLLARAGYSIGKVHSAIALDLYNTLVAFQYCGAAVSVEEFRTFFDQLAVR
jgi:hypothetical protein